MITLQHWIFCNDADKNALIMEYSSVAGLREDEAVNLLDNHELNDAFFQEAHKVAGKRDHYSAYTIVEVLRHNTIVEDNSQLEFKISNNMKPALGRIANALFPALNGLFTFKERKNDGE